MQPFQSTADDDSSSYGDSCAMRLERSPTFTGFKEAH